MHRARSHRLVVFGAVLLAAAVCGPRLSVGPGTERPVGPSVGLVNYPQPFSAKIIWGESWTAGRFAWGDSNGQWIPVSDSDEFLKENRSFTRRGRYRIAAQMRNAAGVWSDWSDSVFIQIDTMPCGPGPRPY